MSLASLPMYDLPETRAATDVLWRSLRRHLRRQRVRPSPSKPGRAMPVRVQWSRPDLLVSQCCGYDVVYSFAGALRVLATPVYSAPGCEGGQYRSFIVVRDDVRAATLADLRGAVCVINGYGSHSGANALKALVAPMSRQGRFFGRVEVSGSHLASLAMLARGTADVAAIDCVLHALLARHRPHSLHGLRVLCTTGPAPAPPFVTAASRSEEECARIRAALEATLADPETASARETLLLQGLSALPPSAYGRILQFEAAALRQGYTELHPVHAHAEAATQAASLRKCMG